MTSIEAGHALSESAATETEIVDLTYLQNVVRAHESERNRLEAQLVDIERKMRENNSVIDELSEELVGKRAKIKASIEMGQDGTYWSTEVEGIYTVERVYLAAGDRIGCKLHERELAVPIAHLEVFEIVEEES